MFDIGWMELLIIGVVALIVVGPKDLPGMFRSLGQFTAKIRRMAREFSRAMEDAADASGVKEAAKDLNSLRSMTSPGGLSKKALNLDDLDDWADDDDTPAPAAPKLNAGAPLSEDRADAAEKIREAAAAKAQARIDAQAEAEAVAAAPPDEPAKEPDRT